MPARLILNADDFGLTPGINRAIAELHSAGALTSATLMANGPAFDDAVRIAHAQPSLGIGCHIVLTDGIPISPPETIPTLLGHDRKTFRPSLTNFFAAVLLGKVSGEDIFREAQAQINRIQEQGISLTHLDTHKHTHILTRVARPLLAAAERSGIRAIRNPFEPRWSIALGKSPILRRLQLRSLRHLRPRFLALPQISATLATTTATLTPSPPDCAIPGRSNAPPYSTPSPLSPNNNRILSVPNSSTTAASPRRRSTRETR